MLGSPGVTWGGAVSRVVFISSGSAPRTMARTPRVLRRYPAQLMGSEFTGVCPQTVPQSLSLLWVSGGAGGVQAELSWEQCFSQQMLIKQQRL